MMTNTDLDRRLNRVVATVQRIADADREALDMRIDNVAAALRRLDPPQQPREPRGHYPRYSEMQAAALKRRTPKVHKSFASQASNKGLLDGYRRARDAGTAELWLWAGREVQAKEESAYLRWLESQAG